jgi:hypothetical protein
MRRVAALVLIVATTQAVWAQSRSSASLVQQGGAPNLTSLLVGLVPAAPLELTGEVDSNSPAVWDLVGGESTMVVLTSFAGRPSRALGRLSALTPASPVAIHPWPGGGVWIEAVLTAPDGTWYGYYHNEIVATACGETAKVVPRVGAARSTDHGATWVDLGILIQAPESTYVCNTNNHYFVGGVGDLSVALDRNDQFLYLFFSQYGPTAPEQGVGVARMAWADRDNPVGNLDIWNDRVWTPLRGSHLTAATPIFLMTRLWHDADTVVDAYWGPTVHWNEYLERYVMLLNRAADETFAQEGIYVSMSPHLADPKAWSAPTKIMNRGQWYPQVIGLETGTGTDKLAGREARFFMSGRSSYVIRFNKLAADLTPTP